MLEVETEPKHNPGWFGILVILLYCRLVKTHSLYCFRCVNIHSERDSTAERSWLSKFHLSRDRCVRLPFFQACTSWRVELLTPGGWILGITWIPQTCFFKQVASVVFLLEGKPLGWRKCICSILDCHWVNSHKLAYKCIVHCPYLLRHMHKQGLYLVLLTKLMLSFLFF